MYTTPLWIVRDISYSSITQIPPLQTPQILSNQPLHSDFYRNSCSLSAHKLQALCFSFLAYGYIGSQIPSISLTYSELLSLFFFFFILDHEHYDEIYCVIQITEWEKRLSAAECKLTVLATELTMCCMTKEKKLCYRNWSPGAFFFLNAVPWFFAF